MLKRKLIKGDEMKKKQHRTRKLRKCELGIKTKSFNHGFRYRMGLDGKFYTINN